jgi:hypothetical protein
VRKPDTILDEVHAIRRRIDEETKDMSTSEMTAYFNVTGERLAKQYGFKRVTADEVRGYSRESTSRE